MTMPIEKRKQPRMNVSGYIADIADGKFVYTGIVQDISFEGLRLHDLPDKFSRKGDVFKVVVSNELHSLHYKLSVYPQWRKFCLVLHHWHLSSS
ncbi:MAG: PilZ domain-containing protein [Candidatus Electrothrix sp. AR4]|nr:PilZ domain-containing protein [Candidatus Electrothrix sp. AR4]